MKKIVFTLLFIFLFSIVTFSQEIPTNTFILKYPFNEDNLYHVALSAVLEKRLSEYGNISNKEDLLNVVIPKDNPVIDLPNQIGIFNIKYNHLDFRDFDEIYKKEISKGKRMKIMKVFPMQNTGSKIEIRFTDSYYSRKGIVRTYALEDGYIVTFEFDCNIRKFIIENVELWGV